MELLIKSVFSLCSVLLTTLLGLINISAPNFDLQPIVDLMGFGVYFFGASTFCFCVTTFVSWASIHIIWAIIEWVYKKIPGVS